MDKRQDLIEILQRAPGDVSGDELASQLGVSTRTVRSYVRALNRRGQVISATHRGYSLDRKGQAHDRSPGVTLEPSDSPAARLQFICRELAKRAEPVSVFDLAESLFISDSTLESDLTRARDVLRQHDLVLRRDHDQIWVEGQERSRRRLVRQMLQSSADGLVSATWKAFSAEYDSFQVKELRERISQAIDASGMEVNEYALADLIMHLVVSVERVQHGSVLSAVSPDTEPDPVVLDLCRRLAAVVEDLYDVVLPEPEFDALYGVVAVRSVRGDSQEVAERVIDAATRAAVAEILEEVSEQYLLGPSDRSMLGNLTLHVQNLIARTHAGSSLVTPLGAAFKNEHPLVHDLALCFATKLEQRLGIEVGDGEVDFLSFHMGLQYVRYLEERDLITITLVVPRYYNLGERLVDQLNDILRGQAVVEELATTLDFDFASVTSDLIVSCIAPPVRASAPVVLITPFITAQDTEHLLNRVRRGREANARRRVRTALTTLIDPRAFLRVDRVSSSEAAIEMMSAKLAAAGYVDATFFEDVLERERRSQTAFGGEFAIPHSMYMDARATGISVLVSDKAIPWGSSMVRLVFLFALSPDGRAAFRDVFEELTRLLMSRSSINALINAARDFDSFMAALTELLDGQPGEPASAR